MKEQPVKRPRRKPFRTPDLSPEDRAKFRAILESDVFRKAITRAMAMKPSPFNATPGAQGASDRLHEIRGWELFEHALYLQAESPKPLSKKPTETYPDQGLIDYEK